uniref:Predicted protein n=1 Tax=Hordeum vulgare subsp. vulgare TaxID=112509 RepID=F2DUH5_HORVV|nr:predicted protein [Hordeum vulgare subsp. vulgare]
MGRRRRRCVEPSGRQAGAGPASESTGARGDGKAARRTRSRRGAQGGRLGRGAAGRRPNQRQGRARAEAMRAGAHARDGSTRSAGRVGVGSEARTRQRWSQQACRRRGGGAGRGPVSAQTAWRRSSRRGCTSGHEGVRA